MNTSLLHLAHLALSLMAICFTLSALIVLLRKSTRKASRRNSSGSAINATIWARMSRLPGVLWTGCAALWAKFVRTMDDQGVTRWSPLLFAVVVCGLLLVAMTRKNVTTEFGVAVVEIEGPYRFTFQPVDGQNRLIGTCDNSPTRTCFTVDICHDYAAPGDDFRQGIILDELIHTVESGCWSLNPDKHAGYFKRRYSNRNAMYAEGVWTTTQQSQQ
jgi:hypothetical protein